MTGGNSTLASNDDAGFATAILMISNLPLNDTEKAEAVRRLMASR
jgi:hypothetical protein